MAFAFLSPGPRTFFPSSLWVWLPLALQIFKQISDFWFRNQTDFMFSERASWPPNLNESSSLCLPISLPHWSASWSCFMYLFMVCFYPLDRNLHEGRGSSLSYSSECLDQALVHLNGCRAHSWPKVLVACISKWILEWKKFVEKANTLRVSMWPMTLQFAFLTLRAMYLHKWPHDVGTWVWGWIDGFICLFTVHQGP